MAAVVITVGGTVCLSGQQQPYPNTRRLGRAIAEYKDEGIHVVAAYYYSQRNHADQWMLIEAGMVPWRVMLLRREAIRLITPGGQVIPLATQQRWGEEVGAARRLLQNAVVTRHNVRQYFPQIARVRMYFFVMPGEALADDEIVLDPKEVIYGDLLFESQTGAWQAGVYTLVIEHEDGRAALPIELE